MNPLPVYLDNNATTPCDPLVVEAMLPYFTRHFGNAASRNHAFGWEAEEAVSQAREQVARLIGAEAREIVFTSGATEADNLALKGVFEMYAGKGNHLITVQTEHKAVLDTCTHIEKNGGEITRLPVGSDGLIDLTALEAAIRPTTILIAVMYANNETGTIQPIRDISTIARRHGILFFCDAAQAAGKIPVDVQADGIDLLALSAHKMYGPKGIGALYVRRRDPRVRLSAQMDGGGHERGFRSGTLNVPAIVGFGKAAQLAAAALPGEGPGLAALRDRLEAALLALGEVYVNGSTVHRLPHVSNLSFRYLEGEALLMGFNKSVAVSSGSACTSASLEPSYVLKAMGVDDASAHASVRFGLGRFTDETQIDFVIEEVRRTVEKLREESLMWELRGK
ncbi:MAG: IscS subfamily cysteine desulfurase [Bacteroidetes bacterium]|nr:IscS subfamily cysteine desulfurase [Bacteroidota bacterium]